MVRRASAEADPSFVRRLRTENFLQRFRRRHLWCVMHQQLSPFRVARSFRPNGSVAERFQGLLRLVRVWWKRFVGATGPGLFRRHVRGKRDGLSSSAGQAAQRRKPQNGPKSTNHCHGGHRRVRFALGHRFSAQSLKSLFPSPRKGPTQHGHRGWLHRWRQWHRHSEANFHGMMTSARSRSQAAATLGNHDFV
jgi:hypothetical protein